MSVRPVALVYAGLLGLGGAAFTAGCLDWSKLETGACGDGFVGREETCDDGNQISGDGCSNDCRFEPSVCGDGRIATTEECDDANQANDDACVEGCLNARCGDGFVWELEEQCDDGNQTDGDGCSSQCRLEMMRATPKCQNGQLDPEEACDDGNDSDSDSCLSGCSWATCGDGRVRTGVEECDPGAPGASAACTRGCMLCGASPLEYFRPGNAHCYWLQPEAASEQQARSTCQAGGGDLWTITSEAESSDVIAKLGLGETYWLGLLTSKTGSNWVSGEATKFTSFAAGEPSDPALRCVAMGVPGGSGTWRNASCSTKLAYVCERSPAFISPTDHHAYRLHTAALDAAAARVSCASESGHLAALETDGERLFVGKNVGIPSWLDASRDSDARFEWPDGTPVDPNAFASGQPDGTTDTQACLLFNSGDKLADAACGDAHAFVCEFD